MSPKILDGITVLDLSTFVTGGFCSLMLANQGAEVVKVERPGSGDDIRHSGPPFINDESPYFWTVNYDKQSIELDLQSEAGQNALYDLVSEVDVFIQNFRPGTAERLGVDYDSVEDLNSELIYCAISAFGQTGPWKSRPGYDLLIQGMSGIMSVTGEQNRPPVKVGLPQTDLITAMWAAFGIVNALYHREQTGTGEYIDLGMLDATVPWLTKQAGKVFADESPERMGTRDPVLAPYQVFKTKDGFLSVACGNQRLWERLCDAIDRLDLKRDSKFKSNADRVTHMDALESALENTFTTKSTDHWMAVLHDAGVPAGPVQSVEEALYNEQSEAREVISSMRTADGTEVPVIEHPLNYKNADTGFESPPPKLGEHTRKIFKEIGYSREDINELAKSGAFGDEQA